jgi:very-short-patch-repair endonuclease
VLRFWNNEILNKTPAVLACIQQALLDRCPHPNPSPGGRGT